MKLQYKIIWFEDNKSAFEAMIPGVEQHLVSLGFQPLIEREETDINLPRILDNSNIDLIIIDQKLARNKKGDKIIKRIRNQDIYTEIIFYSQDPIKDMLDLLTGIDGIFYSSRDEVVEKIKRVINLSLRKVQDVNNMRGLVIAETSVIENQMRDFLYSYFKIDKELNNEVKKNLDEKKNELLTKTIESRTNSLEKLKKRKIEEFKTILNEDLSTYDFFRGIKRCINYSIKEKNILINSGKENNKERLLQEKGELVTLGKEFKVIEEEIIEIRNILAHVREESDDGKVILRSLKQGKPIEFTEDFCIRTRKNLLKHQEKLNYIRSKLC